uniref:FAM161 centrosomal protein B n=1 Tax=Latimeria chalumnae TaxID=7897 RepID=H3BG94_LATCH|nr:PREDICTED: protein FAM161B isoform X1 [Latimeria chalumnae]|eukprot:XP_005986623.2 PREDICTED: protein FAM161B isoform X1 [Latimeria chalumnae]
MKYLKGDFSAMMPNSQKVSFNINLCDKPTVHSGNENEKEETEYSSLYQVFPPKASSDSEEEELFNPAMNCSGTEELLDFLRQDGSVLSDQQFHDRLQVLKNTYRQRLLELGTIYHKQLEEKMREGGQSQLKREDNILKPKVSKELEQFFINTREQRILKEKSSKPCASRREFLRRTSSMSELSSEGQYGNDGYSQLKKSNQRPKSAVWPLNITVPQPFSMMVREAQKKSQLLNSRVSLELEKQLVERQKEEAECQKQFRASSVPAHVYLPLYNEICERGEERRRVGTEKRKEHLLATQKPFSFVEREKKQREEIRGRLQQEAQQSQNHEVKVKKKIPSSVLDPAVSDKLKEAELYRKIHIQMRAMDLLKSSSAPIKVQPQRRETDKTSSLKTKQEKLGFLDEGPKFWPKVNDVVPDFERLYQTFQKEARRKKELKETTRCEPFKLRTSNLPPRQSKKTEETVQESQSTVKTRLRRSCSFSGVSALSSDTLPTYITDAERRRQSAIRNSLEKKLNKEKEQARWMEQHRMNSQTMKKNVMRRAKAMDTHKSLAETYKEKLKQNRQNDQRRMREYKEELEEMKKRVRDRSYLFEQVTQKNAKTKAEQHYRKTLSQLGLDEEFVRSKGKHAGDTPLTVCDAEEEQESESEVQHRDVSSKRESEKDSENEYETSQGKTDQRVSQDESGRDPLIEHETAQEKSDQKEERIPDTAEA